MMLHRKCKVSHKRAGRAINNFSKSVVLIKYRQNAIKVVECKRYNMRRDVINNIDLSQDLLP
jgi:hypothetical protein